MSPYEKLGGMVVLQAILADFYDRVFDDPMIGYLFRTQDKARLVSLEAQFTARALGGDVAYDGRGMRSAHASVRILSGHFNRRFQILVETLEAHHVESEIRERWLSHTRALEAAVVTPELRDIECRESPSVPGPPRRS